MRRWHLWGCHGGLTTQPRKSGLFKALFSCATVPFGSRGFFVPLRFVPGPILTPLREGACVFCPPAAQGTVFFAPPRPILLTLRATGRGMGTAQRDANAANGAAFLRGRKVHARQKRKKRCCAVFCAVLRGARSAAGLLQAGRAGKATSVRNVRNVRFRCGMLILGKQGRVGPEPKGEGAAWPGRGKTKRKRRCTTF